MTDLKQYVDINRPRQERRRGAKIKYMKPILFSTPMVKAILEGRKTMTRRIIKSRHESGMFQVATAKYEPNVRGYYHNRSVCAVDWDERTVDGGDILCPYGEVGDTIYVRETWVRACLSEDGEGPVEGDKWRYWYRADDEWTKHDWHNPNVDGPVDAPRWKPSIHMPREAARIFLKITDIRVERLQDISEEDAKAEGLSCITKDQGRTWKYGIPDSDGLPGNDNTGWDWQSWSVSPVEAFSLLWRKINGENSWAENPWIWAITFEKIDKPQ